MFKKTILTTFILAIFLIMSTSCKQINKGNEVKELNDLNIDYVEENINLKEAISRSDYIVSAELKSVSEFSDYRDYEFIVKSVIKGDSQITVIRPREFYGNISVENSEIEYSKINVQYKVDSKYIIMVDMYDSVYQDEPTYTFISDFVIKLNDKDEITEFKQFGKDIEAQYKTLETFTQYTKTNIKNNNIISDNTYTKSTDMAEIVENSQCVVKAKVIRIEIEAPESNRDTYLCSASQIYKGTIDNEALIVLFKDTVKIGEEYIFLINQISENSRMYTLSSKNSVIKLDNTKDIEKIQLLLDR